MRKLGRFDAVLPIGLSALLVACTAGPVSHARPSALIDVPFALAEGLETRMFAFDIPPATSKTADTSTDRGHQHPGATYVYVLAGSVLSRLGDEPERRYAAGEAWAENPHQAHYIVNASNSVPAMILVVFITAAGAPLTTPLLPGGSGDQGAKAKSGNHGWID